MRLGMWNCPDQPENVTKIRNEHLKVLKDAIFAEGDPNNPEVEASLLYLQQRALRTGGFTTYRRWLRGEGEQYYHEGLKHILKQFPINPFTR